MIPWLWAEAITAAHALGLKVIPWTVNEPAEMARLIDMKIDGLITDYPDRLRGVLARRGFKPPAHAISPPGRDCIAEAAAT